jgi:hypothetical protein
MDNNKNWKQLFKTLSMCHFPLPQGVILLTKFKLQIYELQTFEILAHIPDDITSIQQTEMQSRSNIFELEGTTFIQ